MRYAAIAMRCTFSRSRPEWGQGEMLGPQWPDLDLEVGKVTIVRTLHRTKRQRNPDNPVPCFTLRQPKTPGSRRTIDIPPFTIMALRDREEQQREQRMLSGDAWDEQKLIFTTERGTPFDTSNVLHRFQQILAGAGIEKCGSVTCATPWWFCRGNAANSLGCNRICVALFVFEDDFDPEAERKIFPLGPAQLPPEFCRIALFPHFRIERDAPGKKPDVMAIFLSISFQLGEGEIVRVEGHQPKVSVGAREHLGQPFFVVLRNGGYSDTVKVHEVIPRKKPAARCESHDGIGSFPKGKFDHVQVCRAAVQPVELSDHKSTDAVEAHRGGHLRIEIFKKRIPRFRRTFTG
jgi:hypothetical protein